MLHHFSRLARRGTLLAAYGLILASTACQQEEIVAPAPTTATASADVRLVAPDQATVTAAQTWLRHISEQDAARIDWPHALAQGTWLVAPFIDQRNPFKSAQKQGYRYFIAQETQRGIYSGHIVEIVLQGLSNTPEQVNRLVLQAVQHADAPRSLPGLSGWVIIYSPRYVQQGSLVYQDGILQPQSVQIKTLPPVQTTAKREQTAALRGSESPSTPNIMAPPVCVSATTCGTVNGADAGCYTSYYCIEGDGSGGGTGPGNGGYNPSNGGGGGGWGGGTLPTPFDDKIDDKTLNPCLTAVLNDVKLLSNGKIAEIIKKLSGNSPGFNWNVTSGNIGSQNSAVTSRYDYSSNSVTTTFSNSAFSSASDLSAARTIIHESVHAYLVTYFASNTEMAKQDYKTMFDAYFAAARPDLNATQHNEMALNWIQEIGYNLQQYGQSKGYTLSNDFYINMAWGGLTESTAFNSLSNTIQNEIKNVIIIESTGKDLSGNTQSPKGKSAGCP